MSSINRLCEDLGLPKGDKFTQDWAYELPEAYRTSKWLDKYIAAYLNNAYATPEKVMLMTLILDVANDLVQHAGQENNKAVANALDLLCVYSQDHLKLIDYWALDGEPLEDCFALTPQVRELKKKVESP